MRMSSNKERNIYLPLFARLRQNPLQKKTSNYKEIHTGKGTEMSIVVKKIKSLTGGSKGYTTTTPIERKSEINELRAALNDPTIDKDQEKKREVLQKVIGYMTMGLDTSKLFHNMIMCVHTRDVVQKKMVYQYITHYAHQNQDSAILAINTLANDCRDESPLVRGLALRSLSSLRVPKLVEHLLSLIKEGLNDPSPYVRKTAVLSVVQLQKISPKTIDAEKFVDRLYSMIRDKDVQVVINCINALNELLSEEGGIKVSKKMTYYLLNRVTEYNEWQLCVVLDVLLKYTPQNNNEIFDIMNLLDDRLQIANSAVVMSIANLFLRITENIPKVHLKVYSRLRDPLLLLLATAPPELAYPLLHHMKLMASRVPIAFSGSFRDFYIKHNEPSYIKHLRLEILAILANEQNVKEIMDELSYYISLGDNEASTARKAIKTLGDIAISVSSATEASLTHLLDFLELGDAHILSETFIVLKDILRKYDNEDFCSVYLPAISKHWKLITDPKSICAFLWILGEYGQLIELAPYILETFIDNFKSYDYTVRTQILSSTVKLFFKRPPEVYEMMSRLFVLAIDDSSHADVHDRALFYYRLLEANAHLAKEVISANKQVILNFTEDDSPEFKDKIFSEFNTLSVVYGKPSERFIVSGAGVLGEEEGEEEDEGMQYEEEEEEEEEDDEGHDLREENLLAQYDRESGTLLQMPASSKPSGFRLNSQPQPLDPPGYQSIWQNTSLLPKSTTLQLKARPNANDIELVLKHSNIICLASNTKGEPFLFYFFAQNADDESYLLVQTKAFSNGIMETTVKHEKNNTVEMDKFFKIFQKSFSPYM
jgi:AP-4 complex subunit beta-1